MGNAYWFKPKTYGYGAVPVTWKGWLAVAVPLTGFTAALWFMMSHHAHRHSVPAWIAFLVFAAVATTALVLVSKAKTEGEWRWRNSREQT